MSAYDGQPAYELGRVQGAIDFCEFLRGKVNTLALADAWEEFNVSAKIALINTSIVNVSGNGGDMTGNAS